MVVLYHTCVLYALDGCSIWLLYMILMSSRPLIVFLYLIRVLNTIDGCFKSNLCPLGPRWLIYIILVSSGPLMAVVYHTCLLRAVDGCPISYLCPLGP